MVNSSVFSFNALTNSFFDKSLLASFSSVPVFKSSGSISMIFWASLGHDAIFWNLPMVFLSLPSISCNLVCRVALSFIFRSCFPRSRGCRLLRAVFSNTCASSLSFKVSNFLMTQLTFSKPIVSHAFSLL